MRIDELPKTRTVLIRLTHDEHGSAVGVGLALVDRDLVERALEGSDSEISFAVLGPADLEFVIDGLRNGQRAIELAAAHRRASSH